LNAVESPRPRLFVNRARLDRVKQRISGAHSELRKLARDLLKENLYGNQWLKSVPDFIIYSTLPDFTADNCVMSYGDSHRS